MRAPAYIAVSVISLLGILSWVVTIVVAYDIVSIYRYFHS